MKVSVFSFGGNVPLVDILKIKIVFNLVGPVALYLYESFENNSLNVPLNVCNMTKCGTKTIKNKHSLLFPSYGIYLALQLQTEVP